MTNALLWEGFSSAWPSAGPGQVGGHFQIIPAWGLPLLHTLILLTSGVTVTIAHHAPKAAHRQQLLVFLGLTVLDRQSDVSGTRVSVRVDLGGRRIIKKKN